MVKNHGKKTKSTSKTIKLVDKEISKFARRHGLKPEVKLFDNNQVVTNLTKSDSSPYSTLLNNVAGGSAESQRTGNIIRMLRLRFKLIIAPKTIPAIGQPEGGGDNKACMVGVRVMVVMDRQQVSDDNSLLLDEVIAGTLNNDLPLIAPQTILQQKRFKILYNKVKFCEIGSNYHMFSKVIKLNKDAIFNGTSATDIQKNGVFLLAWYNDFGVPLTGVDLNEGPRFIFWSRLEYTDL